MPSDPQAPVPPVRTPRRSRIVMWVAMVAVVATVVVAIVVGAQEAALLLAAVLLALALVRAVRPAPGPYGISSRSKTFDVTLLLLGGAIILVLALTAPSDALG